MKSYYKDKKIKYVIGVDEAGRGPLAGPVSVGVFCVSVTELDNLYKSKWFDGLRDSKKLNEKGRNFWYRKILNLSKNNTGHFSHSFSNSHFIDRSGISSAIRRATENSLKKVIKKIKKRGSRNIKPANIYILLDGSLGAPKEYVNQKTIIRGDDKVKLISAASIIAKVKRDRLMVRLSKKIPNYGFEIHKGYGTSLHYRKIKKYGLSEIHRRSFLKKLTR